MHLAEKISNAELEVMKILWREEKPVSFSDLRVELQRTMGWEKSTINTLIRNKGVITAHKQQVTYYTPNVSYHEYAQAEEEGLLERLYQGSAKNFVASLCQHGKLSEADIDELKEFFKMGGGSV